MRKVLIMKKYIIYMHIFPNGKKYIGMTSKKIKSEMGRWNWLH
jgi:hypothetical protein